MGGANMLCSGCGKRPARASVRNMRYRGSQRHISRKGHDLCSSCWRNLRNKMRIQNNTVICANCKATIPLVHDPNGHWFKCPKCGHIYEVNYAPNTDITIPDATGHSSNE